VVTHCVDRLTIPKTSPPVLSALDAGPLRCAIRVMGDIEQAKADHGHCRRRANSRRFGIGGACHQEGHSQPEPVHGWSPLLVNAPRRRPVCIGPHASAHSAGLKADQLASGGTSVRGGADRAGAIRVILGVAPQTLLVYALIFDAMPAVDLGLSVAAVGQCPAPPSPKSGHLRS